MPQHNSWTLCRNRVKAMCKAYSMTAELHTGDGRIGVSYTITFWCGAQQLHELRDLSPSRLFDKLSAFDWGMESMKRLHELRKEG